MESTLESRYGWLLLAYPARYRRARGAEMIGTLMESSRPGQRWPSLADTVDLLAGGLRHRAGLSAVPGLARGLALAGPIALAFAGALCAYLLIVEFTAAAAGWVRPSGSYEAGSAIPGLRGLGPLPTLGPIVYAVWVLAALGRVALPRLASRWLVATALAATVYIVPLAHETGRTRPSLSLLAPLLLLGLVALAGTAHAAARGERVASAMGMPATVGVLIALTYWHLQGVTYLRIPDGVVARWPIPELVTVPPPGALALAFGGSALVVAALAMLALLIGLAVTGAWHRAALWSTAVLLVPGLPLVALLVPDVAGPQYVTMWVVMPAGLAAAVVVLASAIRLAGRDPSSGAAPPARGTTESALSTAGTLALGTAAAAALMAWLMYRIPLIAGLEGEVRRASCGWPGCIPAREYAAALAWPLAAVVSVLPVRWVARSAVAAAIAVTLVLPPAMDYQAYFGGPFGRLQFALLALGVVALAGLPAERPRRPGARLGGLGAAAALGAVVTLAPAWDTGAVANPYGVALGAATATVVGAVAGGRAMLEPMSPLWARGAIIAFAAIVWLGVTGPRYQLTLMLAGLVGLVAAVGAFRRARAAAAPPDAPA